ncbi:MAG TPA: peptidylprolyl isomerase, partial [Candidatus Omnitrophota bacterium]|nr:peptidylprolyl isomerase [Candidatus Omnitrophota bacterium]
KKEFLQEIINDTLLYQAALKRGLDKDKDVQKVIDEAKKKIVIARYLKDNIDDKIEITDAEILQYYNEHQNEFMTPEIIRASHILVATQDEALNILGEIMKGGSFEDLARTRSIDPTAQKGGDIGYFPKGQLIAEFEAACEKLKVGEVSEPVKTKLGYHIIKLTDRKSATAKLLKDVKEDIKARMKVKKRQEMFTALLNNLSKETKVVVNEDALRDTGVADSGNAGK